MLRLVSHEIRPGRSADVEQLARLDEELWDEPGYSAAAFRQFCDVAGPLLQVAAEDGTVIGHGLILPSIEPGAGLFASLAVAAGQRRRGTGRALAETCLAQAAAAGLTSLRLTVDPANAPAIHLYRSLGFTADHTEKDYYGAGEDRLVMLRRSPDRA